MKHLLVDISSHGFGHLGQTAPVLNALREALPALRLTIRCGLPEAVVRARIAGAFDFVGDASDFGFAMHDAVRIDLAASARRYREFHQDWAQRVRREAGSLAALAPDLVLTDVAYLPLAGAALAGIPSLTMCSLNWADLFAHYFGDRAWAPPILAQMQEAYLGAERFLRLTPAMPMPTLGNATTLGPVACVGTRRASALRERLRCAPEDVLVLIAFGGFEHALPLAHWPAQPGVRWLLPQSWAVRRPDAADLESLGLPFPDLLASVDIVLTKPGYGTFVEAACGGTAVLYQRREDWPEQEPLIDWLHANARCREISAEALAEGRIGAAVRELVTAPRVPAPQPTGIAEAATLLRERLTAGSRAAAAAPPSRTAAGP